MFKSPQGMKDILPEEAYLWQEIEDKAREILDLYGYRPIRTPVLEDLALFNRSLGNETEIVKKQMFVLSRQAKQYCLRPEGTAAVVRSYLENNLDKKNGFIKLYYLGPMFRAERPQRGRLRQFHHIGVEAIGAASPYLDCEVISLADALLKKLNIAGYLIKINCLGCLRDKKTLGRLMQERLKDKLGSLCPECKERFALNIFRILDCKKEGCQKIVSAIELDYNDYLCPGCLRHFKSVRDNLDNLKIKYSCQPSLVRGLDYYTRTVFEISHPSLRTGSQDAIGAGGRYDHLIAQLGGPDLGAVGFALGLERLIITLNKNAPDSKNIIKVFVVTMGQEAKKEGFILLNMLRSAGIASDMDYEDKSLKAQMRKANDLKVKFALILGENELKNKNVILKNMQAKTQEELSSASLLAQITARI